MTIKQKIFSYIFYDLLGWKIDGRIPFENKRLVIALLPHTSNWDFVIGLLLISAENIKMTIFGKDAFYFFPFKGFYRYLDVVPISRIKSQNFVEQAAKLFDDNALLWVAMAPEGSRGYRENLRSGYYYLAKTANVDILAVGLDFNNKRVIILEPRPVLGTFEQDAQELIKLSNRCSAKNPEQTLTKNKTEF